MLKNFSGGHQFFQISAGIKFLYGRVENLFIYWAGRHNLGPGRQFHKFIDRGSHRGASHRGTWTECIHAGQTFCYLNHPAKSYLMKVFR